MNYQPAPIHAKPAKPVRPAKPLAPPAPAAKPAHIRRRHVGLVLGFLGLVVTPTLLVALYLAVIAQDKFASTTAFTVRQAESGATAELMGGLSQILGTSASGHAELLFDYVQSQQIVEAIDGHLDLRTHYAQAWPDDPVFSIWPDAMIEDLHWFWQRMVRISLDRASGLIMAEVRANDPATARKIAQLLVSESEAMINRLNASARRDAMLNAESDLRQAQERLRRAREAVVQFRARTRILDPEADIQGRMGVVNNLQQQLATALVDFDLLSQTTDINDPRLRQISRRIDVIRNRIEEERESFAAQEGTGSKTDYPQLLTQYESLRVDQEFAERTYLAALTGFDAARSNAERQQLYLATFIDPTLAQQARYPRVGVSIALTLFFAVMTWSILALVYYSLRDRG